MIRDLFIEASQNFLADKAKYETDVARPRVVSKYRSYEVIVNELPNIIYDETKISKSKYLIQGSISTGNVAEVPWICLFDREITETAQNGFYLGYLFQANMKGFYLTLNQGWTQYETEYGVSEGKIKIKSNAFQCQKLLRSIGGYNKNEIKLLAKSKLGKGYEAGNICSKYYSFDSLCDDSELIDDLRNFIGLYRELKGLVGTNILGIQHAVSEEEFQEEIQKGKLKILPPGKVEKKTTKSNSSSSSYPRDRDVSFTAIHAANFKCENDTSHQTFTSAKTGYQFVEAHHLIPMEFQDEHDASIDVPENIISLCPNCHRAFHNSIDKTKIELVKKFFSARKKALIEREINIDENKLLVNYKTTPNNV